MKSKTLNASSRALHGAARFTAPICKFALSLCAALGIASAAKGVEGQDWTGGGSDTLFSTSGNWEGGRASDSTAALRFYFGAGSTVTFDALYPIAEYIWIGNWNNGYVSADGETVTYMTWEAQNSTYGINQTANGITLADNSDQSAALKIESGTYRAGADVSVGSKGGIAYLTMDGGSLEATYWIAAGRDNAATKSYITINNGASLKAGQGTNANGMIDLCGSGTFTVNNGGYVYAPGSKNTGADSGVAMAIANLSGANMAVTNAGGTVELGGSVVVGRNGTGSLVLTGGTLKTSSIEGGAGTGTVTIDGGTIVAQADNAAFMPMSANLTVTVGSNGATLNTDGHEITIAQPILGTGTLTLTGGGSVLFTAQPECTIVANGATYTIEDDNFYWTGSSAENSNWSNPDNWRGGVVPNAAVATVVIPDGAVITLTADATVGTATINGTVALTTGSYFLRADNISSGNGGLLILSNAKLAGISSNSAISVPLKIEAETENQLYTANAGGQNGYPINVTSDISGEGKLIINAYCSNGSDSNVNAGISLLGDNSGFRGIMEYRLGEYGEKYQQRQRDVLAASASSEDADWVFYTNYSETPPRNNGLLFSTANGVYKFGSAQINLPQSAYTVASGVSFVIGKKNADSFIKGTWGKSVAVDWVASTATLMNSAANTGSITLSGGGNLALAASGIPATINFAEDGGYLVLTDDNALNASIVAAVSTIAEGATFGFVYDGANEISLDLSGKAALLAGKKIAKKGSGALYVAGLPSETPCDVDVNEGALVLPHGAVVDDVTVAQGASLVIDLIGAVDNEVVFAYDTVSGDATYRNKASVGTIVVDDTAKTWTYKVTGSSRTFTWIGTDGGSWNDSNNWLADGQFTTDIPTAIDTVQFSESANISASGTLAGDVQIATGVTLTIPAGLTFSKLTAASGAAIAFNSDPIATVGGTLTLITVGVASGVDAALDLPPNYGVSVDAGTGAITATRNAATYAWTGAKDNYWGTWGNWSIGSSFVKEVPANGDSVVFPANDAAGFEFWTVILSQAANVVSIDIAGDTKLSGSITCSSFTGAGKIILDGATITQNGGSITIANNLEVLENTSNYISLDRVSCTLNGNLSGSGNLTIWKSTSGGADQGMKFYGNNSAFSGTFTSTQAYARNGIYFDSKDAVSEDAVWYFDNTSPKENTQTYVFNGTGTYSFGAFVGRLKSGDAKRSVCFGKRSDVDTNVTLSNRHTSNGSRQGGFDVVKVGSGYANIRTTTENGTPSTDAIESLVIQGGTVHLETGLPMTSLGFTEYGGMLQVGYTTASQEIVDVPAETDSETGEVITPAQTHTEYTYTPYDPSSLIKNSTAPIGFDDLGTNSTWATALAESNVGGLIKDGAGTLTLSAEPLYLGPTWVKAGKIVFPNGTDVTLDPRSVGTAENADVQGYKYMDNTVLYGNEPGSDVTMNVDVSTITKVDISDPAFADALVNDRLVVLCRTSGSITGLKSKKFVQGETLLVPERPEDVPAKRWDWMVRIMRINGKNCLCVGSRILPYTITIR